MAKNSVTFDYDKKADVAYLTIGTGEPSYCEERDDTILIERGFYSNLITGLQILRFNAVKKGTVNWNLKDIKQIISNEKSFANKYLYLAHHKEALEKLEEMIDKKLGIHLK